MTSSTSRVAVVGAGLTGLLTAHGLKKNGIDVVVYERDQSLQARARDWTILIHWALPLLHKLVPADILAKLPYAICNPHLDFNDDVECLPVYNGVTDTLLFKSPTPGARRVSRQRLREILIEGLDIHWGCRVKNIDTSDSKIVHLEFDGEKESLGFGFVVGADGAASKIRELLLGEEKAKPLGSGFMFATGMTKYGVKEKVEAVVDKHPVAALSMATNACGSVGVFRADDPKKPQDWETFWVKIWKGDPVSLQGAEALAFMRNNLQGLSGAFKDAIEWTPEQSPSWINEMRYWLAEPWDNRDGRVTLLGDAAHPMLIFRGQGMQHAVMDAVNYVEVVNRILKSEDTAVSKSDLITAFEKEMIERGNGAVKQSLEEAEKALDSDKVGKMLMARKGHVKS